MTETDTHLPLNALPSSAWYPKLFLSNPGSLLREACCALKPTPMYLPHLPVETQIDKNQFCQTLASFVEWPKRSA
jgi:hypothetical protein